MEDEEFHANMYGHAYTVEKEDEDDRGPLDLTRQIEELKAKIKNMNWNHMQSGTLQPFPIHVLFIYLL